MNIQKIEELKLLIEAIDHKLFQIATANWSDEVKIAYLNLYHSVITEYLKQ